MTFLCWIITWLVNELLVRFKSNRIQPIQPGQLPMTTTINHSESLPTLVDVATLNPMEFFADGTGAEHMLIVTPIAGSPTVNAVAGQAINIATKAVVTISSPMAVEVLDATINITNHA